MKITDAPKTVTLEFNGEQITYRRVNGAAMDKGGSEQTVCTPPALLLAVRQALSDDGHALPLFDFDLAAAAENAVAPGWYGPGSPFSHDALTASWDGLGLAWCNPPFKQLAAFTKKAAECQDGTRLVMLVRDAPGTKWWRNNVAGLAYVMHIGRVWFVGREWQTPFDVAILDYGSKPGHDYPVLTSAQRGKPEAKKGNLKL